MADKDTIQILSELLDRLITAQENTAEAISGLKQFIDYKNIHIQRGIEEIEKHFNNGFRADLKQFIKDIHDEEKIERKILADGLLAANNAASAATAAAIESAKSASATASLAVSAAEKIKTEAEKVAKALSRPNYWIKLVVSLMIAMGTLAGSIVVGLDYLKSHKTTQQPEK